jgi:hypothetical protein
MSTRTSDRGASGREPGRQATLPTQRSLSMRFIPTKLHARYHRTGADAATQ